MRIGFIGQGWIGMNYANDFEARGYEVVRYGLQPEYVNNKEAIKDCEIVFIAVPTPTTSSGFDITIVEDLYRRHHEKHEFAIPWKFWNVWCFRTFNHLTKARDKFKREGVHHDALDDARYQAQVVLNYWKSKTAKSAKGSKK